MKFIHGYKNSPDNKKLDFKTYGHVQKKTRSQRVNMPFGHP